MEKFCIFDFSGGSLDVDMCKTVALNYTLRICVCKF